MTKLPADYDGSTPLPDVRHELFVSGIVQGKTDRDAYVAAGFRNKNPAPPASLLRQKPHVIARLAYRRAQLAQQLAITEQRVTAELAKVAFSNMQDFVGTDEDGQFVFKGWDNLSREQLAAVETVTVTRETRVNKKGTETTSQQTRFSLHRKLDALEQLAKHLGLFERDNEQRRQQVLSDEDCQKIRGLLKANHEQGGNGNGDTNHDDHSEPGANSDVESEQPEPAQQ